MRLFAAAHDGEEDAETRKPPIDKASQDDDTDRPALQRPTRQFRGQRIDTPSRPGAFEPAGPVPVYKAVLHPGYIQILS